MRPITTALAVSAFAVFSGAAYAESTMSSGDLIKEMNPDVQNQTELQTGRSAAGGEGPALSGAADENSNQSRESGEYLRQAPAAPADVQ